MMKKIFILLVAITLAFAVNAQSIMLRTANTGISKSNDRFTGFQATFSFDQIESATIAGTERGVFSALTIAEAYPQGEYGAPQLPVFKKMIAIPVGAMPKVVVNNFTASEHNLGEYGIHTIFPLQPDVRKDKNPNEVPFVFDAKAYGINDYNDALMAEVEIIGTMRGVIIGMLTVRPVQYNPVAHSIMIYNDIDIEVVFENADYKKTEEVLINTFSPYFKNVYETFFNRGVTKDLYDDYPDLYTTPVHMLVISHRMFEATLQPWLEWKTKKGFSMDVNYTDEIGTTAAQIKAFCHDKYNQGANNGTAPTFIVFVGDVQQVPASQTGSSTSKATDLYYATIGTGYFPSMYYSRMSAQTTQQLANIIEKILYYEQYQFADPAYLDNVLLIAGVDGYWNPVLAQPQINYASTHYYNAAHGYANVHKYLTSPYTGCYTHLNNVGFANYTAHCGETVWDNPKLNISNVNALTNVNKYFVAMGNCCLAADFGYNECIGEAMIRAEKKGAVGYIGSSPNSYWNDDFHFTVGAYNGSYSPTANPTLANTKDGCYDFMFRDADFNTLCSHVFSGNLAVTYAMTTPGYTTNQSPRYYWEAYNVLGDGSLMPYNGQANENQVSHDPVIYIGLDSYEVTADPGSYVAISKDGVLLGVAVADASGVALVPITPVISGGNVDIVVTRNQRQPYMVQVPAVAQQGPYVVFGGYEVVDAEILTYISTNSEIEVTLKNVGIETSAAMNVTISCADPQLTITQATAQCPPIAPDGTATVTFKVTVANDIEDGKTFLVDVTVTEGGKNTWESKMPLKAYAPNFSLEKVLINGEETRNLEPGLIIITAVVANKGGADAYNVVSDIEINSEYLVFACPELNDDIQSLPAGENVELTFTLIADPSMPYGHEALFNLLLSAQYGRSFTAPFKAAYSSPGTYCVPGATNCSGYNDRITSLVLVKNSDQSVLINNPNPACNSGGYTDYTNTFIDFEPGATYQIKVKTGYANHRVRGWIDLNGNNIFDDNEVMFTISCTNANTEYTANFTIPQDFVPGVHRFRIRTKDGGSIPGACEAYGWGQTLDYSAVLPELYPRVRNVSAELEDNNITVTWEAPNDETLIGYNIYRDGNLLNPALLIVTNFEEENVSEGVYVYSITAVFEGNNESFAQISNVICHFAMQPCESPINLEGIEKDCGALITWDEPEMDGLLSYYIYRDGKKIAETIASIRTYHDELLENGNYAYQVSAVYEHCGVSMRTDVVTVLIDCVGINEAQADLFQIFPNPANNSITIKGNGLNRVEIYDLQGRKLAEYNNIKDHLQINDLSKFESGVYFVKMYTENHQMATKRLVIVK